jgi:hypothetical protein
MIGGPRDKTAYGLVAASFGLALALVLGGICWIAVEKGDTSSGLAIAAVALGSALIGMQIPFPLPGSPPESGDSKFEWSGSAWLALVLVLTTIVFGVGVALLATMSEHPSLPHVALAAGLFGLLIPSPAKGD